MVKKKIFLASSSELKADREQFELFIDRKNKEWINKGVFLELVECNDFLDTVSKTRLQDEYNKQIRKCALFVLLFWTKVGRYTKEEFTTAFHQFKITGRPLILTYFKDAKPRQRSVTQNERKSLKAFLQKLKTLGHFYTPYKNAAELQLHFNQQLEKLVTSRVIVFKPAKAAAAKRVPPPHIGAGAVYIGGKNKGAINTGTQVNVLVRKRRP